MPVIAWLLNLVYGCMLVAATPWLAYRIAVLRKNRDGWGQKFLGRLPVPASPAPRIWFHAVSVGEVLQLQSVVDALKHRRPDLQIVVSTTTSTGLSVAREKFTDDCVCYFPFDFPWSVRRALDRVRPDAVVLVELELWPNFILEIGRRGIPLALVNGRMSDRSFGGYRRIRHLLRMLFSRFDRLAVQTPTYADRLVELGAPEDRVTVTGSIKFDGVETDRHNAKTLELREAFGLEEGQRVFVAGSTQAPEEEYALETYLQLRCEFPDLRLVLVPRHKERFDQVARLVAGYGVPLIRRSKCSLPEVQEMSAGADTNVLPVLLLDTLGELAACWGLADIAFVGGSLTSRGGQNMIEPAAYGAAVMFGPNTQNFRDVVEILRRAEAAIVVNDRDELTATVRELLLSVDLRRSLGEIAQKTVLSQQGATTRTVDLLAEMLSHGPTHVASTDAEAA